MPRPLAVTDAKLDRLVEAAEEAFARTIRKAFVAAVKHLKLAIDIQAAGPPAGFTPDDATIAQQVWSEQLGALGHYVEAAFGAGSQAVMAVLSEVPTAGTSPRLAVERVANHQATEYLTTATNRLRRVGDLAWTSIRQQLTEGFTAGESIDKLSARVREAMTMTEQRARTIARTEVVGASNHGTWAGVNALPPQVRPKTKTWISTHDLRTRPSHVNADRQTVRLEEPFVVGGWRMMHPHDLNGPAEEVINCRCTVAYDLVSLDEPEPEPPPAAPTRASVVNVSTTAPADIVTVNRAPPRNDTLWKKVEDDKLTIWSKLKAEDHLAGMDRAIGYRHNGVTIITQVTDLTARTMRELPDHAARLAQLHRVRPELQRVEAIIDQLRADTGNALHHLRQVVLSPTQNPGDAYFAAKYNMPHFRSAATAKFETMTVYGDNHIALDIMSHELGHVLDAGTSGIGVVDLGRTAEWKAAQIADAEHARESVRAIDWRTEALQGHSPTPYAIDGVSVYGQTNGAEDVAESFRLFLVDRRAGSLAHTPSGVPITFADIWPNRAALLDDMLKKAQRRRR